jgi:hypothetical protein
MSDWGTLSLKIYLNKGIIFSNIACIDATPQKFYSEFRRVNLSFSKQECPRLG